MHITEYQDSWFVIDEFDNGEGFQFDYDVLIPKSETGEIKISNMSKSEVENHLNETRRELEAEIKKVSLGLETDYGLTVDDVADSIVRNDSSDLSKEQEAFVTTLMNSGDVGGLFQDFERLSNILGLFDTWDSYSAEDLNSFVTRKDPESVVEDPMQEEDVIDREIRDVDDTLLIQIEFENIWKDIDVLMKETPRLTENDLFNILKERHYEPTLLWDSAPRDLNEYLKTGIKLYFQPTKAEEEPYPWRQCMREMKEKYGSPKIARRVCGKIKYHNRGKHEECSCEEIPHSFEEDCPICIEELVSDMKAEEVYPCDKCSTILFSQNDLDRHKELHTQYGYGLPGGELIETTDKNYEEQDDEEDCENCSGAGDIDCLCGGRDENCPSCQGTGYVDCPSCEGWGTKREEIFGFGKKKPIEVPSQSKTPITHPNQIQPEDYPESYHLDAPIPDEFRKPTPQELSDYSRKPITNEIPCSKCGKMFHPLKLRKHMRYAHALSEEKKIHIPEQDELAGVPYAPESEKFPDKKYRPKRPDWTCQKCGYPARSRKWYRQHMKERHGEVIKKETQNYCSCDEPNVKGGKCRNCNRPPMPESDRYGGGTSDFEERMWHETHQYTGISVSKNCRICQQGKGEEDSDIDRYESLINKLSDKSITPEEYEELDALHVKLFSTEPKVKAPKNEDAMGCELCPAGFPTDYELAKHYVEKHDHCPLHQKTFKTHTDEEYEQDLGLVAKEEGEGKFNFNNAQIRKLSDEADDGCEICSFVYNQLVTDEDVGSVYLASNAYIEFDTKANYGMDILTSDEINHLNSLFDMDKLEEEEILTRAEEEIKKGGANPWAVCRSMQNEHGWSDDKTERCIMKVKKATGYKYHKKKDEDRYECNCQKCECHRPLADPGRCVYCAFGEHNKEPRTSFKRQTKKLEEEVICECCVLPCDCKDCVACKNPKPTIYLEEDSNWSESGWCRRHNKPEESHSQLELAEDEEAGEE